MATEFTKKFVQKRFENWAKDVGLSTVCWKTDGDKRVSVVGAVYIDSYRGYQICQIMNERGGITVLTGSWYRMTGRELDAWMQGCLFARSLTEGR